MVSCTRVILFIWASIAQNVYTYYDILNITKNIIAIKYIYCRFYCWLLSFFSSIVFVKTCNKLISNNFYARLCLKAVCTMRFIGLPQCYVQHKQSIIVWSEGNSRGRRRYRFFKQCARVAVAERVPQLCPCVDCLAQFVCKIERRR